MSNYTSIVKSQRLVDSRIRDSLRVLFRLLDRDGNGKISANKINLDFIPTEILVIFKPLLIELETYNEELDEDEFIESSIVLYESLDINSRNIILSMGKKVSKSRSGVESENKFHPQISKKSAALAEMQRKRRHDMKSIENRLLAIK